MSLKHILRTDDEELDKIAPMRKLAPYAILYDGCMMIIHRYREFGSKEDREKRKKSKTEHSDKHHRDQRRKHKHDKLLDTHTSKKRHRISTQQQNE